GVVGLVVVVGVAVVIGGQAVLVIAHARFDSASAGACVVAFLVGWLGFLARRGFFQLLPLGRDGSFHQQPFDGVIDLAQLFLLLVELLGLFASDERDHLRRVRVNLHAGKRIANAIEDSI